MNTLNETIPSELNTMPNFQDLKEAKNFCTNHTEDFLQFFSRNLGLKQDCKTI